MNRFNRPYDRISQSLPVLKGWAISWVVAYHLMGNTQGYLDLSKAVDALSTSDFKGSVEAALDLFISAGATGVNVFLVISGFGLTASWWKRYGAQGTVQIPLSEFWRKRVFRIFPCFWGATALSALLYFLNSSWAPFGQEVWQQGGWSPLLALLATVSTLRNFIPDYYYFLNGAWWYVGLSVQLYFIFPWLICCGCRWGWDRLLAASLLFSWAYRAAFLLSPISEVCRLIALAFFPARLFEFTFGIYLAMTFLQPSAGGFRQFREPLDSFLRNLLLNWKCIPLGVCLFVIGLSCKWLAYPALSIFEETLIAVGLFCSLVNLSQFRVLRLGAIARTTGRYSYGIYLTHMNIYLILWPIATMLVPSYWPRFALVAVVCLAVGAGFETGFDRCLKAIVKRRN